MRFQALEDVSHYDNIVLTDIKLLRFIAYIASKVTYFYQVEIQKLNKQHMFNSIFSPNATICPLWTSWSPLPVVVEV
jgi:hypothetical protein